MAFSWVTQADDCPPCAQTDPEAFFPGDEDAYAISAAKAICSSCTFVVRCLSFALANRSLDGVWGGTTRRERERLRRGSNPRPTA